MVTVDAGPMIMVVKMAAGFGADFFPGNLRLRLLPAIAGGMGIEYPANLSLGNQLLGVADAAEEIHHMASHKDHSVFLSRFYHLIAILIGQGDGFFAEDMLFVLCGNYYRLFVEIIGGGHNHCIYIISGAQCL